MASSSSLRTQNKSQTEHVGILKHQELNQVATNSSVKLNSTQFSKRGAENKDPNESTKPVKGVNTATGVSRLPVLAKSQQSTVTDVSSNLPYNGWEQRPLSGKAHKRKTCTKHVPFSLSQSWTHNQKCTEVSSEPAAKSECPKTHLTQRSSAKTPSISRPGTKTEAASESAASDKKHSSSVVTDPVSLSTQIHTAPRFKLNVSGKDHDIISAIQKDLSTKLGNITLAHTQLSKAGVFEDRVCCRPSTTPTMPSLVPADRKTGVSDGAGNTIAGSQTPRVSRRPPGPDSDITMPQRVSVKKKKKPCDAEVISGSTVPLSPDPSAHRNILLNEGIRLRGSIYSAQRVPLRKPRTHTAALVGEAAGGAVTFSPDPSALQSVLLNEEMKQGTVRTPRGCPSARASAVYSAQRVPVLSARSETSKSGAVAFSPDPSALRSFLHNEGIKAGIYGVPTPRVPLCPSRSTTPIYTAQRVPARKARAEEAAHTGTGQTPGRKWTTQRVLVSRSDAVMRSNTTRKMHLLNISPGFGETQDPSMAKSSRQEEEVVQKLFQEEPEHEGNEEMEHGVDEVTPGQSPQHQQSAEHEAETETEEITSAQPFIQAPHRQSVIVFSSDLKLPSQTGASFQTSLHDSDQTSRSQSKLNSDTARRGTSGKQCDAKASSLGLTVCALRRRAPPLEEMFLDEECALYTSRQQSWRSQPRCLNPVASTLHFQDSTRFVPIIVTAPSLSPALQLSSSIKV